MFLTRKAIKKVRTFAIVFLILGGIFLTLALLYAWMGEPFLWLLFLDIGCFPFSFVVYKTGLYAEGVSTAANLLRKGIRLVYVTLQPAEFVRMYQETATSPENVRVKPDLQLLLTLFQAYASLGEDAHALETLETALSAAPEKKKPRIRLAKCSVLFAMGRKDEAEQLLNEVQNVNPDASTQKIIDALKNTDRAMAYEEYQTTEAFFTQFLRNMGFRYPLALLSAHFTLGEVFTKMGRKEEAAPHFAYCTENGGATIYKSRAAEMLNQSAPVPPQA